MQLWPEILPSKLSSVNYLTHTHTHTTSSIPQLVCWYVSLILHSFHNRPSCQSLPCHCISNGCTVSQESSRRLSGLSYAICLLTDTKDHGQKILTLNQLLIWEMVEHRKERWSVNSEKHWIDFRWSSVIDTDLDFD